MKADVARDLEASARDFKALVWPAIRNLIGGGDLATVESSTLNDYDSIAGVDAWQLGPNGMVGIASRVQWGETNWASFTVRLSRASGVKTEYQKRLDALQHEDEGYLSPQLTIQGYVSEQGTGKLLSVGVVATKDLFRYIVRFGVDRKRRNPVDGNLFGIVFWAKLIARGYPVQVFTAPKNNAEDIEVWRLI